MSAPNRPHCEAPTACRAKGKGHCRSCQMRATAKAKWQDPEFRAKRAAAVKAANQVWPDCPDHLRDDYATLRCYMSAREARAALDPEYAERTK